ncbi:zinc-dependent alcohol dehydrogenase family protein [Kovacikia minuta CCNUW1]|uniref:zinc-dependent alcohol dehydrogenase family protein n=1 Tax=Kovacikia minuta TaxID=2931930 RepID=UPI001CCF34C9|nr:zinc-dependent alcohol dehydrogenase family protein [Kovacikia minuta]UBF24949.1 zinc-dependent alcohol dehydrogenase family protein [Kovacikia minuta CCNUW1]
MTRVVRFHQIGGPEVLQIEDLEVGAPGPDEIRIRVEAIGLNRAEAMFRSGTYLEEPHLPARLGYEASGIVEALGSNVQGFEIGEAVSVIPAFSMNQYGVYAEQAIVPAAAVLKRPAGLSAVEAAAVWMQYLTAYGALIEIGRLSSGDAVVITAASSSVGLAAIQIANSVGALAIATTRTSTKAEALQKAGAAHVIVTQEQDLVAAVMQITDGKGARIVFDPVAGPGIETLAQAMSRQGILFIYGNLSGQATPFPSGASMLKSLSLRGYVLFELTSDPQRLALAQAFIRRGIEAGTLKPIIAKTFTLNQMIEAHRYLESNQQFGKIVVTVSQ